MENDSVETLRDERDRLAARLRRAEEELRLIVDNVPAGIAYLDANERYGFVNRTLASWLGRSQASLVGLHPNELLGGEGYELVKPHLVRALGGKTVTFTAEAPYATGRRWVEVSYVPHFGAGVQPLGVVMMAIDVTQRRREEDERMRLLKELQDRNVRLGRLRESGMIGLIGFRRDGVLTDANDTFLSLVGRSRAELEAGRVRWSEMTPPEFADRDARAFEELDDRGVCTPFEKEYVHKDGHRVPVLIGAAFLEGSQTDGIAWTMDVSARRRAEERQAVLIAAGSTLARPVLDATAMTRDVIALLVRNVATCASVELFGDGDVVLERLTRAREGSSVEHPTDGARLVSAPLVARARVLGRLTFSSPERTYGPDDRAMAEELGRQIGIAIDNARLFEAAQVERRHAEEASRAKDEFLAMVSHELRTPLNAMLGWATLLRSGNLVAERREHALEVIERNVRAQAQLVEELLDISRVITGKLRLDVQIVDLEAIVSDAVDAMRPAAEGKGVGLHANVTGDIGPTSGDPDRLRQVVYNLLSNAVRHTPRGGAVSVEVARRNGDVEIAVTDTGEGIERELLPHIFERFRQGEGGTTRRYGGLGLGLAIVKHIVELHGGAISVVSEGRGTGAKFIVSVPMMAPRPRDAEQPLAARRALDDDGVQRRPELAGLRALVVDDDADARELVATVLAFSDVDVVTAGSAAEALAQFAERIPDVLLSDIGMPGADGYSLIEEIRKRPVERGGRTPAIALTAFARLEDRTRALLAGYNMHVAKPIEPSELLVVVSAISGRLGQGQAARS